jgi:hypothetical protein
LPVGFIHASVMVGEFYLWPGQAAILAGQVFLLIAFS